MNQYQQPIHWKVTSLEDVATLQRGKDLPTDQRRKGLFPVVGSNGVVGYHSEYAARGPGVCVGRSGSVGKVTWVLGDYWPLNTVLWVRDFHDNVPGFVAYFLDFLDLGKYASGVSVPTLNRNTVHPLEVALPPLPEQRAITHILRAVQAAREARQREAALERERKAALMAHLFTYGTRGEPTKQTPIEEMPESWEVTRLGDAIMLQRGYDLPESQRQAGPFPVISSSGVFASHVVAKVPGPGVVTGRYGTIGEVFYIESDFWPLNTTLFVREFKGNDPLFVSCLLRTINLHVLNDKTSVPGINRNAAHAILVGLPTLTEQREIASVLPVCDAKIGALGREIALLDELFQALLEELMSGRVSALPLVEVLPS